MKNQKFPKETKTKEITVYNTQKDTSFRSFIENSESKDTLKRIKKSNNENHRKEESNFEEEKKKKEEKEDMKFLEQFYKKLPKENYSEYFDDIYIQFFLIEENNLNDFDKAVKILEKYYIRKENEITKKYRDKINKDIIEDFNINSIKIYFDFNNLYEKLKNNDYKDNKENFINVFE